MNFPFALDELERVFPTDLPQFVSLTDSYGDAVTETELFRGKLWNEVDGKLLRRAFNSAFFFSHEAMHYYFPAFVWCSRDSMLDDAELAIAPLLSSLAVSENEAFMQWRRARWTLFTASQWDVVDVWVNYLHSDCADRFPEVELAYKAIILDAWRSKEKSDPFEKQT